MLIENMKTKIIIITSCKNCRPYYKEVDGLVPYCILKDRLIHNNNNIPNWCPLEDAEPRAYRRKTV